MSDKEHKQTSGMSPKSSQLTAEVVEQLEQLLKAAKAGDYRDTLLEIYHLYIMREHGHLPVHFDAMASHMYLLTEFFRIVESEMQGKSNL